ncbi:MAG: TolC family protein [Phycisphaerae bacterium]|nr:TolC family protein [Phycisphaerae bacterium]
MTPLRFATLAAACLIGLLPACDRHDVDIDAVTEIYRHRIAQMPKTVQPRLARPTRAGTTQMDTSQPDAMTQAAMGERKAGSIMRLSLQETLRRALANSLDIKVESYSPGIAAQDVIAAEAAFDAVIFADGQFSKLDSGSNSTIAGMTGESESRNGDFGFKKTMATGGQFSATYKANRLWAEQPLQRFNPHYENDATLQLTQPLLKNAGVDVNRAQIRVNANKREAAQYGFRKKVIDTLAQVEQGYWQLFLARQSLALGQELLARTEMTHARVVERLQWDALPVNVSQAASAVASRRANVIRLAADVRDAEDQLKNLLNDPALPLTTDIALIPVDEPVTEELAADPQRELWTALENRPELFEARLNVANANIARGVARNQQLPKLDMFLQWNLNGLRENFPETNEQILHGDLQDYVVGVSFEFPIGNRAANANYRKSSLQVDQAVTSYHKAVSDVMLQIQVALRDVQTSYREIVSNRDAVRAATENLSALIARRVGMTPEYLNLELQTQETQANARRALLGAIANYNIAIVKLEQAKGTLLQYDRVELAAEP